MNRRTFAFTFAIIVAGSATVSRLFAQDQPKKTDHPGQCAGTETLSGRHVKDSGVEKNTTTKAKKAKKAKAKDSTEKKT